MLVGFRSNFKFTIHDLRLMAVRHRVQSLDPRYALLLLALVSITCFAVALGIYDHSGARYEDYLTDWGDGLAMASVSLQPLPHESRQPTTDDHTRYCHLCSGPCQSFSTNSMESDFVPVGTLASNL